MKIRLIALLLSVLLLAGCQSAVAPNETEQTVTYDWVAGESPVPSIRTGIEQQGIYGLENSFECTESGVYFMVFGIGAQEFLLYGDHGSDTLIKLCGRSDCLHESAECDACVTNGNNVCYYDGFLYTTGGSSMAPALIRMDPDGSDHVTVLDTSDLFSPGGYGGTMACMVTNGVFVVCPYKLDSSGEMMPQAYYYKLDGSMRGLQKAEFDMVLSSAGDAVLVEQISEQYERRRFLWDPKEDTLTPLTDLQGSGYYGPEAAYFARDGKVYRFSYATGQEELLLDSGQQGDYRLICFPDCFVLASKEKGESTDRNLYIYNWAYELVGTAHIDHSLTEAPAYMIVGETPERIILSGTKWTLPQYYIEKSDFGTGNIEIHEYELPDLEEELAKIEEEQNPEDSEIVNDDNW